MISSNSDSKMTESKPLNRLKVKGGTKLLAHFETDEYEVLVACTSSAMKNLHIQMCSIDHFYEMGYCRSDDETLEEAMASIAKASKLVLFELALKHRENIKLRYKYAARN